MVTHIWHAFSSNGRDTKINDLVILTMTFILTLIVLDHFHEVGEASDWVFLKDIFFAIDGFWRNYSKYAKTTRTLIYPLFTLLDGFWLHKLCTGVLGMIGLYLNMSVHLLVCIVLIGAAVAEWLSSWLAEQEDQGSIPGLATWIFRDWLSPASKLWYGWNTAEAA